MGPELELYEEWTMAETSGTQDTSNLCPSPLNEQLCPSTDSSGMHHSFFHSFLWFLFISVKTHSTW